MYLGLESIREALGTDREFAHVSHTLPGHKARMRAQHKRIWSHVCEHPDKPCYDCIYRYHGRRKLADRGLKLRETFAEDE